MLPETAAPSVGAFEETFRALADDGADGIVCINLSAQLSATMQSAQVAAKALDGLCPIEVIDSKSASMGIGNLVLHAARRAAEGADLATIVREVEVASRAAAASSPRSTRSSTSARAGASAAPGRMLGSMLSIKPIISVVDGAVDEAGKVRTRGKALQFILDKVPAQGVEPIACCTPARPTSTSSSPSCQPEVTGDAEIIVGDIGPVVGVHTGPRVARRHVDRARA